ncbi:MAG: hypothetical protein HYV07_32665 [Deltaproteobacteria bacterium]|nr:hypothetical protein [Deltaproteobacteria bacterium]
MAEKVPNEKRLLDYRNGFDHAWTSQRGAPADLEAKGREYFARLSKAVEVLFPAGAWQS